MRKPGGKQQERKELHVCLTEGSQKTFYASLVSLDGLMANLRSSTPVGKGATIYLVPVPEGWQGQQLDPDYVMKHPNLKSGQVSRISRGSFMLRLATEEAQHMRKQIRDGSVGLDDLTVKITEAGAVTTIQVTGGLGMASATKLQAALRKLSGSQSLALLDTTDMTVTSEAAVKFLLQFIKESEEGGKHICILTRPSSRLLGILAGGDDSSVVEVHTNREMAVASLIKRTLEG
ncbi:MAG: hypothetical protein ABIH23_17400 [bacterium]